MSILLHSPKNALILGIGILVWVSLRLLGMSFEFTAWVTCLPVFALILFPKFHISWPSTKFLFFSGSLFVVGFFVGFSYIPASKLVEGWPSIVEWIKVEWISGEAAGVAKDMEAILQLDKAGELGLLSYYARYSISPKDKFRDRELDIEKDIEAFEFRLHQLTSTLENSDVSDPQRQIILSYIEDLKADIEGKNMELRLIRDRVELLENGLQAIKYWTREKIEDELLGYRKTSSSQ